MKKKSILKIIIYIILTLIVMISIILIKPGQKPKKNVKMPFITTNQNVKPKPTFRKDGELSFLSSSDENIIKKINIEIANDYVTRMQGLMYRDSMAINQGMLFIFDTEEPQSFWMKNTYIPLDIIFVNSSRRIVKIQHNTTTLSEASIPSIKPALYVVEVNAGFCKKYDIKEGDIIKFK